MFKAPFVKPGKKCGEFPPVGLVCSELIKLLWMQFFFGMYLTATRVNGWTGDEMDPCCSVIGFIMEKWFFFSSLQLRCLQLFSARFKMIAHACAITAHRQHGQFNIICAWTLLELHSCCKIDVYIGQAVTPDKYSISALGKSLLIFVTAVILCVGSA